VLKIKDNFQKNIKFKSLAIIAAVVTIIQLISTIILIYVNYSNLKYSFTQRVELLAKIQSDALSNPIWDFNTDTIQATLQTLKTEPSFLYAAIYDADGKLNYWVGEMPLKLDNTILSISKPIIYSQQNKVLGKLELQVSLSELSAGFFKNITLGVINFVLLQIFTLGVSYLVLLSVINPIQSITKIVNLIKDGILNNNIPCLNRLDEIGAIANAVSSLQISTDNINKYRHENELKESDRQRKISLLIKEFFSQATQAIKSVELSSVRLDETAKQMFTMIKMVDDKAFNVKSIAEQTSKNVENVTNVTGDMTASIEDISMQIVKTSQIVSQSVEQTEKARITTDSLDQSMNKIGEVVSFINKLAKQVNMLALNATIESARAGEAGKGFAVVASEIKSLAHKTSAATFEIAEIIHNFQSISDEVVKVMNLIKESISNVNQYAITSASAVEKQNHVTKDIFTNMQKAADGAKEMAGNIIDIKSLTANADKSTCGVMEAAHELNLQAESLNKTINKFIEEVSQL
jgi:methyl-accepting chemotaxis protein